MSISFALQDDRMKECLKEYFNIQERQAILHHRKAFRILGRKTDVTIYHHKPYIRMKDRIQQLMESQHMNQQSFASLIGLSPASLSNILQERTRPTLKTAEAIKQKMPNVSTDWLLFGEGSMFITDQHTAQASPAPNDLTSAQEKQPVYGEGLLNFQTQEEEQRQTANTAATTPGNMRHQRQPNVADIHCMKNIDKQSRRITEIRVFYDDQTWESFVPKR